MEREKIIRCTNSGKIIPVGELVRCRICKYGKMNIDDRPYNLPCRQGDKTPDWFCAEGKRENNETN